MQEVLKYQQIDAQIRKLEAQLDMSKNKKGAEEMRDYVKKCQAKLQKVEEAAKGLSEKYTKAVSLYNEL